MNNIHDDLLLNEYSFNAYKSLFSSFVTTDSISIKPKELNKITKFFNGKNL